MKSTRKTLALILAAAVAVVGMSACTSGQSSEFAQREQAQAAKKDNSKTTLEKVNLKKKLELEENPSRLTYVYVIDFGKVIGYYVAKGKISSSGSQLTPEQDVMTDRGEYGGGNVVVDGPQDDGTYGDGDPGIFFFTTDGTLVETELKTLRSSQPIPIDAPRLSK